MSGWTMSSGTSTNNPAAERPSSEPLKPWQFFVLAALACASAGAFVVRGQGITVVVTMMLIMGATVFVGLGVLRSIRPLVAPDDERSVPLGQRTRVGLEQEKALALRTIKELEFDRAMGKLSESDFHEMSVRLRARAARIMTRLDANDS